MREIRSYATLESIQFEISKFDVMGMLIKADKVPPNFRLASIEFDDDSEMLTLRIERQTEKQPDTSSTEPRRDQE